MTTPVHNDYTYVDKTTGQTVDFAAKSDELMVRLNRDATQESLNDVVENTESLSVSQGYNLERGFAAVWVTPGSDRESARTHWTPARRSRAPFRCSSTSTERPATSFPTSSPSSSGTDVDAGRIEEILGELGARVITKQRTPGYYTRRRTGGPGSVRSNPGKSRRWTRFSSPSRAR